MFLWLLCLCSSLYGEPIDTTSPIQVTPGIRGAVELTFQSDAAKYYQVDISSDLTYWDPEGYAVKGTGGQLTILVSTRNLASAFYRLRDNADPNRTAPVGPPGPPGSDASVTNVNVNTAFESNPTASRTSLGLGTAAIADASTAGGTNKIPQYDANSNLTTGNPLAPSNINIFGGQGNILIPDKQGIRWYSAEGQIQQQTGIFNWDNHDAKGNELIINSANRLALISYGLIQVGPNDPPRNAMHFNLTCGTATAGDPLRQSKAITFRAGKYNGGDTFDQMAIQAVPLSNASGDNVLRIFNNAVIDVSNPGSYGAASGTMVGEFSNAGLYTPGTAPAWETIPYAASITQRCSKYKAVQVAKVTLAGDTALTITGAEAGMRGVIYVTQGGSGSHKMMLPAGSAKSASWALSTSPGSIDRLTWEYDGASHYWTIDPGLVFSLDPDAQAYVTAVEAALHATASEDQKTAIDDFVKSEKASNRWSLHKRIFLTGWANEEANAIDMVTRSTGTFVNGPTHANGYVQGNGTSQYFNSGASPASLGLTASNAGLFILSTQGPSEPTQSVVLAAAHTSSIAAIGLDSPSYTLRLRFSAMDSVTRFEAPSYLTRANQAGILTGMRFGGAGTLRQRKTAGVMPLASSASSGGTAPDIPMYFMAQNYKGAPSDHSDFRMGACGLTLGMSDADTDAFTENLKNLWETCTGLTLP